MPLRCIVRSSELGVGISTTEPQRTQRGKNMAGGIPQTPFFIEHWTLNIEH